MFWLDSWLGGRPLCQEFPELFAICSDPGLLVADAISLGGRNIGFRRTFGPVEANSWGTLLALLPHDLSASPDSVTWTLSPAGNFSVGSAYRALLVGPHCLGPPISGRLQCRLKLGSLLGSC